MDKGIEVEATLATALGMYSTSTSPQGIVRYIADQVDLPWPKYEDARPEAVKFLVELVLVLTPPSDKRLSFKERPGLAAREAVPQNYGDALNTMVAMGWGNVRLNLGPPTSREVAKVIQRELDERARGLALALLEVWEREGNVHRLS